MKDFFSLDGIAFRVYDPETDTMYTDCLVQCYVNPQGEMLVGAFPVLKWDSNGFGVEFGNSIKGDVMRYSGMNDRDGNRIYQGDVLRIVDCEGENIKVVCQFGKATRLMLPFLNTAQAINMNGSLVDVNEVDIVGFYFERLDDNRKTFPIVSNYIEKHDLEIMEIIGNVFQHKHLLIK